jgi:protein TonB
VLTESEVEKPAAVAAGSMSPRYPEMLRVTGAEGSVVAQFVVDTTGRAIGSTLQVLRSTHALFGEAVKNALPMMRFLPAEVGGRKVRQLVQQTFVFAIGGSRALAIGMVGREMRTMHPEMRLVRHS